MSTLDRIINYCNNCINDVYISEYENYLSCIKHKQACKRFLKDIENPNYYWDEEEVNRVISFFSKLKHSKGVLANKPIILNDWQVFIIGNIYGLRKKSNNYRKFKTAFVEVARKNAKSQLQSGIILYEMSCTATKNKELIECYCAGTKSAQSKIIFEECKLMLKGSKLAPKFDIRVNKITHKKTGSFITPLSKDDGKTGKPLPLYIEIYIEN